MREKTNLYKGKSHEGNKILTSWRTAGSSWNADIRAMIWFNPPELTMASLFASLPASCQNTPQLHLMSSNFWRIRGCFKLTNVDHTATSVGHFFDFERNLIYSQLLASMATVTGTEHKRAWEKTCERRAQALFATTLLPVWIAWSRNWSTVSSPPCSATALHISSCPWPITHSLMWSPLLPIIFGIDSLWFYWTHLPCTSARTCRAHHHDAFIASGGALSVLLKLPNSAVSSKVLE